MFVLPYEATALYNITDSMQLVNVERKANVKTT